MSAVTRYGYDAMLQPNEGVTEQNFGSWVLYDDYLALQAALREALKGWQDWLEPKWPEQFAERDRINELRKFIDDK